MSSALDILLEMGFPLNRATKALKVTGETGAEAAMEWLLAHTDDPNIDEPMQIDVSSTSASAATTTTTNISESPSKIDTEVVAADETQSTSTENNLAKSLKCDDCGKLMRNETDVEFHAIKTGHQNFSESSEEVKALSEEERKERVQKLEERIKMRRLEKEAHDRREQIEREKQRRKTGQEMSEAKKKLEEEELKQIAEQRKKEKLEEKIARQKVLDQIEKDKQARREKFGSSSQSSVNQNISTPNPSVNANPQPKKEYEQTKIQIRLPDGQSLTQTFGIKEELAAVRLYVQMNQQNPGHSFVMMTSFPKRVFTDEDMEKPLYELGLVPSAVLIITKSQS